MDKNYDPKSLRKGIENCKKNIAIFEDAIRKEEETMHQYREWIRTIEEKEILSKPIIIEVNTDGNKC